MLLESDALDSILGKDWKPLSNNVNTQPVQLLADVPSTKLQEVFKLWQDAFEWSYYDEVLAGIKQSGENKNASQVLSKGEDLGEVSFQAMFCIVERECSLRRHIESVVPDCKTLGTPGFFGVEFFMQQQN